MLAISIVKFGIMSLNTSVLNTVRERSVGFLFFCCCSSRVENENVIVSSAATHYRPHLQRAAGPGVLQVGTSLPERVS